MTKRKPYPTDLNDNLWGHVSKILERHYEYDKPNDGRGRPRFVEIRDIVDAIAYRWASSTTWRMLPHDFPKWETVYHYHKEWNQSGVLSEIRACVCFGERVLHAADTDSEADAAGEADTMQCLESAARTGERTSADD